MTGKLGILAGSGDLPGRLVDLCRRQKRECLVLAFEGHTDPASVAGAEHAWLRLGAAARGIEILKQAGVSELVMAGAVARPSLTELRPDLSTARWLARIGTTSCGDDGLLRSIIQALEAEGFTVRGIDDLMTGLVAETGTYGRIQPDETAWADIERGVAVAKALGAADVGQAVVVQQGLVLAVEALEGTDALLRRAADLRRDGPGGVLVKVTKPQQDRRADLPSIGPNTVEGSAGAGLKGIALEAGGTLLIDREAVIRAADATGLFVVGLPTGS